MFHPIVSFTVNIIFRTTVEIFQCHIWGFTCFTKLAIESFITEDTLLLLINTFNIISDIYPNIYIYISIYFSLKVLGML